MSKLDELEHDTADEMDIALPDLEEETETETKPCLDCNDGYFESGLECSNCKGTGKIQITNQMRFAESAEKPWLDIENPAIWVGDIGNDEDDFFN